MAKALPSPLLTPVIEDNARRYRANVLVSVPAHLRVLAESQLTSLASVRQVFSSGAPLPDTTARELHRRSAFLEDVLETNRLS